MNNSLRDMLKVIAFYLPQYHPIPENNRWWGEGFTEWTNVRKAVPRFPGHYQPHVPGQLGYYDLRDPATRRAQAELAREYGIHGFCYYHYWFNGKRLLETPFNEVLNSGEPDFPFCLCWANENWSRRWDGSDQEILMAQHYSDEDSLAFIEDLIPAFRDERYIRVNGKPLLLVYRTGLLPDPKRTAEIWREAMHSAGIGDLYLVRVENFMHFDEPPPRSIGFDAAMEFAPYWGCTGGMLKNLMEAGGPDFSVSDGMYVYDYDVCMRNMLAKPIPDYKLFRGVFPGWDNSARRKTEPSIFINSAPEKYAYWLSLVLRHTMETFEGDERLVFINAWNEWGEGCHLEPDERYGAGYLEATRLALKQAVDYKSLFSESSGLPEQFCAVKWYEELKNLYRSDGKLGETAENAIRAFANFNHDPLGLPDVNELRLQYEQSLMRKEEELTAVRSSLSWKLTAPLRWLHQKLVV